MSCLGFFYGYPRSIQEYAQAVPYLDQNRVLPNLFHFTVHLHLTIDLVIGDNPQCVKLNPIEMFMIILGKN